MRWTKVVVCLFHTYYTDDLGTKLLFTKSMILWTKVRLVVAEVRGRLSLLSCFPCCILHQGYPGGKYFWVTHSRLLFRKSESGLPFLVLREKAKLRIGGRRKKVESIARKKLNENLACFEKCVLKRRKMNIRLPPVTCQHLCWSSRKTVLFHCVEMEEKCLF